VVHKGGFGLIEVAALLYDDNLPVAGPDISSIIRFASVATKPLSVVQVQDLKGGYQS
jgi:hypothetical protein